MIFITRCAQQIWKGKMWSVKVFILSNILGGCGYAPIIHGSISGKSKMVGVFEESQSLGNKE